MYIIETVSLYTVKFFTEKKSAYRTVAVAKSYIKILKDTKANVAIAVIACNRVELQLCTLETVSL